MQYFYYVMGETKDGKHACWPERVAAGNNIAALCRGNIDLIHPCKTWTEARELADFWNDCYRDNGSYLVHF